ncbi:hypothetical protein BDV34DRAFT_7699 [Aspergillus parasiticus]|uniref:Uncharacterized protein n=1 Tax=Aspergillus parasiticus TaxID=5067 RepID=A0A5N6DX46_ASPPA|nr:hypothetical protein BDV34DRAFT_7699 [Aspergillus parasiticus]
MFANCMCAGMDGSMSPVSTNEPWIEFILPREEQKVRDLDRASLRADFDACLDIVTPIFRSCHCPGMAVFLTDILLEKGLFEKALATAKEGIYASPSCESRCTDKHKDYETILCLQRAWVNLRKNGTVKESRNIAFEVVQERFGDIFPAPDNMSTTMINS